VAKPKGGEQQVIYWKLAPSDMLGGRLWLTVRRSAGAGKMTYRLSTVWAKSERALTNGLALIPVDAHHPRGSWPISDVSLRNGAETFDLADVGKDGRNVRAIRVSQPVYEHGVKMRDPDEVIFTREKSTNPSQALANNGMYGALVHASLCVKNSGKETARVAVYLRYPVKNLAGVYVGAVTTYAYGAATRAWKQAETRAVDLSNVEYGPKIQDTDHRWTTQRLADYPVKAGEMREIPLLITTDGPAMLPVAIVLAREPL